MNDASRMNLIHPAQDFGARGLASKAVKHPNEYRGAAVLVAQGDVGSLPLSAVAEPIIVAAVGRGPNNEPTVHVIDRSGILGDAIEISSLDVVAAVAISDEGSQVLDGLLNSGLGSVPDRNLSVTRLPAGDAAPLALAVAVQGGYARLLTGMASRNAALARSLAVVRRELDTVQDAFFTLEELISALHQVEKLAFSAEPSGRQMMTLDENLVQALPVASRALSAVELHFFVDDPKAEGVCHIDLLTVEDGAIAASWSIRYSEIRAGWMRLELARGLMGAPRSVELHIRAETASGVPPKLMLAAPSVVSGAACRRTSGASSEAPLALRIWYSLPGQRTRRIVDGVASSGSTPSALVRRIGAAHLASVEAIVARVE